MTKLLRLGKSSPSSARHRVIDKNLRQLLETTKRETRLLGDVQRNLLGRGMSVEQEQRDDALHPSEISHNDWCPRASYHRVAGHLPNQEAALPHWQMQMIWDEGHEIHHKWQGRIWDLGRLRGTFYCVRCQHAWTDTAPGYCDRCGAGRVFLQYHEVPLYRPALRLVGHADGLDGEDALIEIKSIGINTLRFEVPDLLKQHTYRFTLNGSSREFIDLDALWKSIRVPFPSHIRQAHLYTYMGAPTDEIFLYECKWNQRVKELVVKYREERIADRLDWCSQIVMALNGGKIPACPFGGCADCQRYEEPNDRPQRRLIRTKKVAAEATPGSPRDAHQNGGGLPPRRLQRPSSRGARQP